MDTALPRGSGAAAPLSGPGQLAWRAFVGVVLWVLVAVVAFEGGFLIGWVD